MKSLKQITAAVVSAGAIFMMGCAATADSRSTGQVIDDTALHAKVKTALLNDPVVSGTKIDVDVQRGVVLLSGAVNGGVEKQKAEAIARGVDGVRGVDNKLVVRQAATGSPASVETDVEIDTEPDGDVDVDVDHK